MKYFLIALLLIAPRISYADGWTCVHNGDTTTDVGRAKEGSRCSYAFTSSGETTGTLDMSLCSPQTSYVVKPNDTTTSLSTQTSDDGGTTWTDLDYSDIASGTNTEKDYAPLHRATLIQVVTAGTASGTVVVQCGKY